MQEGIDALIKFIYLKSKRKQVGTCKVFTSATAAPALLELATPNALLLLTPKALELPAAGAEHAPLVLGAEKPLAELLAKALLLLLLLLEEPLGLPKPMVVTPAPPVLLLLDAPPFNSCVKTKMFS